MLNQVVLMGKLIYKEERPEVPVMYLTLKVKQNFKTDQGETIYDDMFVYVNEPLIGNLRDHLTIGALVGVKAHLEIVDMQYIVVADKITFLQGE